MRETSPDDPGLEPPGSDRALPAATALLLVVFLVIGMLLRLPFLYNSVHSFNSDEAINALVIKHLLDGKGLRLHNWGTTYFGIQEGLLAIPFVWMVGMRPLAFKLAALLGYLFMVLCVYALAKRLYGPWEALAAAGLLAAFSPQLVQWTSLANVGYGLVVGWGCLLLVALDRLRRAPSAWGAAGLGFMAGFGFYMYELFLVYLAALLVLALSASFAWRLLLTPSAADRRHALRAGRPQLRWVAVFALGFAAGWAPKLWTLLFGELSEKRPEYTLVNDLEQLRFNLVLLLRACAPAFLGVNPWAGPEMEPTVGPAGTWEAILGAAVLVLYAVAWIWGLLRVRPVLASALSRPPRALDVESLVVLLPLVTVLLFLVSPNAQDIYSNRYLFPWLSSLPVLTGALGVRLWRRWPGLGATILALLIAFPLVQTLRWEVRLGYLTPHLEPRRRTDPVEQTLAYLRQRGIQGGYGAYWFAYKASFLSHEGIIVTPFRDWDRYPPYTQYVDSLANPAYVFMEPYGPLHEAFFQEIRVRGIPFEIRSFGPYRVYTGRRGERLLPPDPRPLRRPAAELAVGRVPAAVRPGTVFDVPIRVTNRSDGVWPSRGLANGHLRVAVSYHWLEPDGNAAVYDGRRSPLPRDLLPGESTDLIVRVAAPAESGRYLLVLTLVQENVAWFDAEGGGAARHQVEVRDEAEIPAPASRGSGALPW